MEERTGMDGWKEWNAGQAGLAEAMPGPVLSLRYDFWLVLFRQPRRPAFIAACASCICLSNCPALPSSALPLASA